MKSTYMVLSTKKRLTQIGRDVSKNEFPNSVEYNTLISFIYSICCLLFSEL
jgi:hypothetical protein